MGQVIVHGGFIKQGIYTLNIKPQGVAQIYGVDAPPEFPVKQGLFGAKLSDPYWERECRSTLGDIHLYPSYAGGEWITPWPFPEDPILGFHQPGFEFLSNFYPLERGLVDGRNVWPTVEHGYQASKDPENPAVAFLFSDRNMHPGVAKREGRLIALPAKSGSNGFKWWDEEKQIVMWRLLVAKFTQYPELADRLIATGNRLILELNTWGDMYWGVVDGSAQPFGPRVFIGHNYLGGMLMALRYFLNTQRQRQGAHYASII